jgi:arginine/lysine/ornithine decarboxylase
MRLLTALNKIKEAQLVSFHMPGHKNGRYLFNGVASLLDYDITEIPGADHLHDAQDCIQETEQTLATLYGAYRTRLLVGGSTVGILSMILGTTQPGDKILLNRNAHKSVYNAIEMNGLVPIYLFPEIDDYLGIPTDLRVNDLNTLAQDVKICILTYPTYEGLCYSIKDVIDKCHALDIPVLVDEAHGAHLILHENGPKSSLDLGADIVVQSFHKTLPAMTQTAGLHFSKKTILSEFQLSRVDWYLKSLQSSSPSYPLMASVDNMIDVIQDVGAIRSKALEFQIESLYDTIATLKCIGTYRFDFMDITKVILIIKKDYFKLGFSDGYTISNKLRFEYGIQSEYDSKTMVLLMTSFCNEASDFEALKNALIKIDRQIIEEVVEPSMTEAFVNYEAVYDVIASKDTFKLCASDAVQLPSTLVALDASIGEISAEYIIPYPPGIPILVPGERVHMETLKLIPTEKTNILVLK